MTVSIGNDVVVLWERGGRGVNLRQLFPVLATLMNLTTHGEFVPKRVTFLGINYRTVIL